MRCVLFSGGWDSVAAALIDRESPLIFFNYGQIYFENEREAVLKFSAAFKRKTKILSVKLGHDAERRNFLLLSELKRRGYSEVVTGNRNILPIFDKYKDSNWLSMKMFGYLMNMKIEMPVVGWTKKRIVEFVQSGYVGTPYNCYKNNKDFMICGCPNCRELKKIMS